MSFCIPDSGILRSLEKPQKLYIYDGTGDPDEHVKHVGLVSCPTGGEVQASRTNLDRSRDEMVEDPPILEN